MRVSAASGTARGSMRTVSQLVVLTAFFLQSFLVQTHLHNLLLPSQPAAGVAVSAPDRSPPPLDADNCLLCQEYLHGGVYLTPAAAAVLPPGAVVALLPLVVSAPAIGRLVSHIWMGRAPPQR